MDELNQDLLRSTGDLPPPQDASDDLSHLHIDSHYHCPCTVCGCTPTVPATTCGCTPTFNSSTVQNSAKPATTLEPDSKKAFFGYDLSAFSKIPLPTAQPSPPSLRRCISDPSTPPRAAVTGPGSSSLPPKAPVLKRSVSDPTTSPGTNSLRNNDESPTTKRLRRMQDQLKVMNLWVEEIVHDVDDSMSTEEDTDPTVLKGEDQAGRSEETVSVDKVGDCINIRLNCPCKKVFHLLLSGKDVFYNLV